MPRIAMTQDTPWSPLKYDEPAYARPPLPVSRIQQIHITPGTSSAVRRLRYKFLHHTAVQATSTNCLHSCEDDILKVVCYEQDTLQVTKWNSDISVCDDVNTDPIRYGPAERETFPPEDRDQLYPLLAMKYVSPRRMEQQREGL